MPKLQVLSCPSCGASLSIEQGASTATCSFCGNTSVVPEELRGNAPAGPSYASPSLANQKPVFLSGMPLMDQLPRLRELGDLVRAGRLADAARLYQDLFGANDLQARAAVEQLGQGQPVSVSNFSALRSGSSADAGLFRFDGSGMPQVQIQQVTGMGGLNNQLGSPMMSVGGAGMSGNMYPPPVIDTRPARQAGGCIAMIVVISVVGSILLAVLALVAGFLPFVNLNDLGLGDVGQTIAEVTNQYPIVVQTLGGEGTGRGRFTDARHVGVDADGNIYAADYGGGRVQVFDSAGEFQTQWTVGDGTDVYVTGFDVARDGSVYLVYGSELYHVDGQTGEELEHIEFADGWGFEDVVALPDGGIAATWYKNRDDLVIFDDTGELVADVQNAISSITGKVAVTMRLTVDNDGNLLVLNTDSAMVFKFTPDGEHLDSFGGSGDEPGQLRAPYDVAVDNVGQIYISASGGIQIFDATGRFVKEVSRPNEFSFAYGMAVDDDNFLYVAGNNHVYKYQLEADE